MRVAAVVTVDTRADRPDAGGARRSRLTLGELADVWVDEPVAPFQIALAGDFDAAPFLRGGGTADLTRIRAELVRRAGRVPVFRRRVIWTRPGQGRPYWADGPAFGAERHVTCGCLPPRVPFTDWCARQLPTARCSSHRRHRAVPDSTTRRAAVERGERSAGWFLPGIGAGVAGPWTAALPQAFRGGLFARAGTPEAGNVPAVHLAAEAGLAATPLAAGSAPVRGRPQRHGAALTACGLLIRSSINSSG